VRTKPQDVFDWLLSQVNGLSIMLLAYALVVTFLHGVTIVGICGS